MLLYIFSVILVVYEKNVNVTPASCEQKLYGRELALQG